jgi:heat shock protein HtpX
VKNRDTLTSCVAATIAGVIGAMGHLMWYASMFSGGSGNRDRESSNPFVGLAMLIFAPIAASLIQLAISRSREFVADHDGAKIAGSPDGLINALRKLESAAKVIPFHGGSPAFNNMFIVSPLTAENFSNLFRTHPSTEERIARLTELRGKI